MAVCPGSFVLLAVLAVAPDGSAPDGLGPATQGTAAKRTRQWSRDPYEPGGPAWNAGGAFGAIDVRLTEIDGRFGTLLGAELGVTAARHLMLSVGGHGLVGFPSEDNLPGVSPARLSYGHAGVWGGVYSLRWRPVYGVARLFVGGGLACERPASGGSCGPQTGAFVSALEAGLYLRIVAWARVGLTGGYRFVVPADWEGPGQWALSGAEGSVRLEVGAF